MANNLGNGPKRDARPRHAGARGLGVLLIVFGILFNKWILEFLLSQDQQIESSLALTIIGSVELVAVLLGIYLVAKGPRVPFQIKDIALTVSSVAITLGLLEIGGRTWLEYYATEQQKAKYLMHGDIDPTQLRFSAHHYLNYYLNTTYGQGRITHNSLGYRDREFEVEKPDGVYRIVALGGSTT